jgi:predicted DNA-binding protein
VSERRDAHRGIEKTLAELVSDQKKATGEAKRSRNWDRENPAFSFRIRPEDARRMRETAEELDAPKDALARALIGAALDAVEDGRLSLEVEEECYRLTDKRGRERTVTRIFVLASWASDRIGENAP